MKVKESQSNNTASMKVQGKEAETTDLEKVSKESI